MQFGTVARGRARNSSADANVSDCHPSERINDSSDTRTAISSSTTKTIGVKFGIDCNPRANDEKGPEYEEEVLEDLQNWSVLTAAEVHHVGTDNRPGDIVVRIPADGMLAMPLTIAIETRDRPTPVGRKVISDSYGVRILIRANPFILEFSLSEDCFANSLKT